MSSYCPLGCALTPTWSPDQLLQPMMFNQKAVLETPAHSFKHTVPEMTDLAKTPPTSPTADVKILSATMTSSTPSPPPVLNITEMASCAASSSGASSMAHTTSSSEASSASDEESDELLSGDVLMETAWKTRFRLICKPEQSRKTALMIARILHEFEDPPSGRKPINFIFCANSLLLTKQTGVRLVKEVEKCGLGRCEEYSSQKGALKTKNEVLAAIAFEQVTNVVWPSNSCRVGEHDVREGKYDCKGVIGVIKQLSEKDPDKYTFNIWMDEADKFIKPLVKFRELLKRNINASVWCITATPEKLFEEFGNQNVLCLENTTSSNYHGWGDNRIKHFEPSTDCAAFVRQVLDKVGGAITSNASDDVSVNPLTIQGKLWEIIQREYAPDQTFTRKNILEFVGEIGSSSKTVSQTVSHTLQNIRDKELIQFIEPGVYKRSPLVSDTGPPYDTPSETVPNTRWFIPGGTRKKSHRDIKDACVKRGFAVFVVNGDGISLTLPCGTEVAIEKKDDLLNSKIKKMYAAHNLHEHPVAITGNICIGRGISISDPEFMFTHGILSECKSGAEASQLAGRLKGNMKDWPGFQPPTVFTTHLFDEIVSEH